MTNFSERVAHANTKIIATVGPACAEPQQLEALIRAGVDVFRLNFAHGKHDWLTGIVQQIREIGQRLGRSIGILGDLSGPKIRLEELPGGSLDCRLGDTIEFIRDPDPNAPQRLTCTYDKLIDDLQANDQILLADGAVTMVVVGKEAHPERVVCQVVQPGIIRSRQGINLPGAKLSTPSLTEKDRDDLAWAVRTGIDYIGLSFVRKAEDIDQLREAIRALNPEFLPHIVAKIEKMEAVDDLDRILQVTDAVMVARGDLGVEVDITRVPGLQKQIIRKCNQHRVPVITATQMLDSMQHHNRPTRAEASDVANAVLDGSDAVMLSGETAAGEYPLEAVTMMCRLAQAAEKLQRQKVAVDSKLHPERFQTLLVTEAVTLGAGMVAEKLDADAIVVATHSGRTALAVSKQRLPYPILGLTDSAESARRMALYWGVIPIMAELRTCTPQQILEQVVHWGRELDVISTGSKLVLIASSNWETPGHDLLLVHEVE